LFVPPSDRSNQRQTEVKGSLLYFREREKAYEAIAKIEPRRQYRWGSIQCNNCQANILFGKNPYKGSLELWDEWDGWKDPVFAVMPEVAEAIESKSKEILSSDTTDQGGELGEFFALQAAYLLVWSGIERYATLRYGMSGDVMQRLLRMADQDVALRDFLKDLPSTCGGDVYKRPIYKSDRPEEKCVFDAENPKKCVEWYYQIRCNITHRGKDLCGDVSLVRCALVDMLNALRAMIKRAREEANRR
jgi:hypothetical protein